MPFDLRSKRIFVAGHRGMVGSAITRLLSSEGCEVLTVAVINWICAIKRE